MKSLRLSRASALALFMSLVVHVQTQAQAPLARRRMAFSQSGTKLYIQGGYGSVNYTDQFNLLDLSTSWPTSSPAWTMLKDGPLIAHHTLVAVSPTYAAGLGTGSLGYLVSTGGTGIGNSTSFWNNYDLQAGSWASFTSGSAPPFPGLEGHTAVMNPNDGLIYIIGGYFGNTTYNALSVFDPSNRTIVSQKAAKANTSLTDVAAVWSSVRNTILTFGGSRAPSAVSNGIALTSLQEYDPTAKAWKTMATSGTVPTRRLDHCVAASEDGSKIVLFGGSLDTKTYFYDIYILDVSTATWKQGTPASSPRTRMACGLHSNQFIAWGGSSGDSRTTTMHDNVPIVYDILNDAWIENYNATGPQLLSTSSSSSSSSPSSTSSSGTLPASTQTPSTSKSSLVPTIGGAAGGAVVLIGCAVAFFVVRQRRKRGNRDQVYEEDDRFYRRGRLVPRQQDYMVMNSTASSSDAGGRDTSNTDVRRVGKMSASEYHAAEAEAVRGEREGSSRDEPSSGYWDGLAGGSPMRSKPGSSPRDYSPPRTAASHRGHSPSNGPAVQWPAQAQLRQQQQHQQMLLLQQQQQHLHMQQQRPNYPMTYPYKAPYDDDDRRTSMVSDAHSYHHSMGTFTGAPRAMQGERRHYMPPPRR